MVLTAITGGIGSGKSVASAIVAAMGYPVYDCDSRAKALMDADTGIHAALCSDIHPLCVTGGVIDRRLVSDIVFSDPAKLAALNRIVHSAVRADLKVWCVSHSHESCLFVETAILIESGLDAMVDEVWEVTAPEELRIRRVMARNGLTAEAVKARIASLCPLPATLQSHNDSLPKPIHRLTNDGLHPLLPQIESLLSHIKQTPSD